MKNPNPLKRGNNREGLDGEFEPFFCGEIC